MKPAIACDLWSINRWLRWTGWRLFIEVDVENLKDDAKCKPTRIGFNFWGWKGLLR